VSTFAARILLPDSKLIDFDGPADITMESTDAIVNAANSSLMGGGGVDGAIHRAGGPAILAACREIVAKAGRLPPGQAVITPGGNLPARYVIHTVGPLFWGGKQGEAETLAACYRESIKIADDEGLRSVAFPSISTGAFGYPVQAAAKVAIPTAVQSMLVARSLNLLRFVLFDLPTLHAYVSSAENFCRGSSYKLEKGSS
jgi:O-acetyl-ADP-ribose deacetylase